MAKRVIIVHGWDSSPQFEKVKSACSSIVAIFSDDDPVVPQENIELFRERLEPKIIIEHQKRHFNDSVGVTELPIVLNELLGMIGPK